LTTTPGVVALLGSAGRSANFVFARSSDLKPDMNKLFKAASGALAGLRGGGSPHLAQGGGPPATLAEVEQELVLMERELFRDH
jgi:alanyl-tRNA synthetase